MPETSPFQTILFHSYCANFFSLITLRSFNTCDSTRSVLDQDVSQWVHYESLPLLRMRHTALRRGKHLHNLVDNFDLFLFFARFVSTLILTFNIYRESFFGFYLWPVFFSKAVCKIVSFERGIHYVRIIVLACVMTLARYGISLFNVP